MSRSNGILDTEGVLVKQADVSKLGPRTITIEGYKRYIKRDIYKHVKYHKTLQNGSTEYREYFQIPRYLADKAGIKYDVVWRYKKIKRGEFTANLHDYQNVCVVAIILHLRAHSGVCFEMEAGLGKSYVAGKLIHLLGLKTLYITPTCFLMNQAIDDLQNMMPHLTISSYSGSSKGDGDVVVMVINSLAKADKSFLQTFGFSIYDECQMYTTPNRLSAIEGAPTRYTMGLSAEVPHDKIGMLLQYRLGSRLVDKNISGFFKDDNTNYSTDLRIIYYHGHPNFIEKLINVKTDLMQTSYMTAQSMCDVYRMQLVVDQAKALYDGKRNLFIWTDSRLAVDIIKSLLEKIGVPSASPETQGGVGHLKGGVSAKEVESARNSRVIVATYQYAYVGVSLPKFDAMIMASPRKANIYQTLKRIYRMGGDPSIPRIVVDIVDAKTGLARQLESRMHEYRRDIFNSTVKRTRIVWRDIKLNDDLEIYHKNTVCSALHTKILKSSVEQSCDVYTKLLGRLRDTN